MSRSVTSFAKVQALTARAIRNSKLQLRGTRIQSLQYVDIGCGWNIHADLVNLDYSWHPGIDLCCDVTRGLPFVSGSMRGVFSEHCLEHFSLDVAAAVIQEIRRVLRKDGTLRVVVPDAEAYLREYVRQIDGDLTATFPFQELVSARALTYVNRVFYQDRDSPHGHCAIFDYQLLRDLLLTHGFAEVNRAGFREGRDPILLVDSERRRAESLYVEARA